MGETQSLSTTNNTLYNTQQNIPQLRTESTLTKRLHSVESYSSLNTRCDTKLSFDDLNYLSTPCLIENNNIHFDLQTLHESNPIQKDPNPLSSRSTYYHKLLYKNILPPRQDKTHNTIFIFDWDDTLFPTTFIAPRGVYNGNTILLEIYKEQFLQLEQLVHSILSKALAKGVVYIVTNSSAGWVEYSTERYYPSIVHMLKHVNIISARGEYEHMYPKDPFNWKYLTFKRIMNRFNEQMLMNLIVIGDSCIEIEAGEKVSKLIDECYIKTIKLKCSPTLREINKQLQLVNNEFIQVYSAVKNLSLKIEKQDF